jgi:toxin ParE1/3/4
VRGCFWSARAVRDLAEAIGYIAAESPIAAVAVRARIEETVQGLARWPIGRAGRILGTYEKVVLKTPHIVAYRLSEETVTILRIVHSSRDWPAGHWPS